MSAAGVCPVCAVPYSEHIYPEMVPCPRCHSLEYVRIWESWGCPSGDLQCDLCSGFLSSAPADDYWTYRVDENGQVVEEVWGESPADAA